MATPAEFYDSLKAIEPSEVDVVSIAPEGTPLYSILAMPGREQTAEGRFDVVGLKEALWTGGHRVFGKEVDENAKVFTVNGALLAGATTFVLDSTAGIIANAILNVPSTGEQVKVVSVTNATDIVVERAYGTTAAAGIADGAVLYFLSTSLKAGEASVDTISVEATEVENEMQKIVTTIRQTDAEDFLAQYPGVKDKVGGFMKHQMREHAKRIERAMLLGQKKYDATNKQGVMEGVYELAKRSGNVTDLSGGATKESLVAAFRKSFKYGNRSEKVALCGADALDKIAFLFEADRIANDTIKNTDLSFDMLTLPGGQKVKLVKHPDMESDVGLNKKVIVLDADQITVVYASGSTLNGASVNGKTRVIPNVGGSNYANTVIDIVTYATLKNHNARAHGLITMP